MTKTIIVFLGLLAWAGSAAADSITIVNDRRAVSVVAQVVDETGRTDRHMDSQGPADVLSATAIASAGTSVANGAARLTSSITGPTHLSGSGGALASFSTFGQAEASAAAVFDVDFVLGAPSLYTFNGTFNISDFPARSNGAFNEARWAAALSSGDSFVFNLGGTHTAFPPSFAGILSAGSYHFLVETTANGFSERSATVVEDSQFQFALDLAPVDSNPSPTPEPASLLLLGTGIVGLVAGKARTRRTGLSTLISANRSNVTPHVP